MKVYGMDDRGTSRRGRASGRRAAVVAGLLTGAMIPSTVATAAVTWTLDPTGTALTVKSTDGDPLVIRCDGGVVRVAAAVATSARCATLASLIVNGSVANDVIDASAVTAAQFPVLTSVTLSGQAGDDRIVGSERADRLFGGTGADRIKAGPGDDTVQGNDGNDRIAGEDGSDWISGGDGDDTLTGHRDDVASGGADLAQDWIGGNQGADVIVGQDADHVQNPYNDLPDRVKWTFTWSSTALLEGVSINGGTAAITSSEPADWSLSPGGDCGCAVVRGTSRLTGARSGLNHLGGPLTLTMSGGDDRFTANFRDVDFVVVATPVTVRGGAGNDTLRIFVVDDAGIEITPTEVRIPGLPTIRYSGIESVIVLPSA